MTVDMSGAYKRVNESHYPGRIRETNLSRERADDQRHLAEFEEFVKKEHREKGEHDEPEALEEKKQAPEEPHDVVELHDSQPQEPAEKPSPSAKEDKPSDASSKTGGGHLDITI